MQKLFILLTAPVVAGCLVSQVKSTVESEPTVRSLQPTRALTSDERYSDFEPAVSPDGKTVVFSRIDSQRRGRWKLWTVPAAGGPPRPFTPDAFPYDSTRASWSPDGRSVAFRAGRDDKAGQPGGIWLMNLDGGDMRPLTDEKRFDDFYPQWSREGKWMTITRAVIGEGYDSIWTISLDGTERRITSGGDDGKSTISPDSKHIAFVRSPPRSIWILSIKEGEKSARRLTAGRGPAWSPGGTWIAFASDRSNLDASGDTYAIFLKRVRGGPVIQVTDGTAIESNPEWSPDGKSIVVGARSFSGENYIAVIDVSAIAQ